jgi:hypothetical protein
LTLVGQLPIVLDAAREGGTDTERWSVPLGGFHEPLGPPVRGVGGVWASVVNSEVILLVGI